MKEASDVGKARLSGSVRTVPGAGLVAASITPLVTGQAGKKIQPVSCLVLGTEKGTAGVGTIGSRNAA